MFRFSADLQDKEKAALDFSPQIDDDVASRHSVREVRGTIILGTFFLLVFLFARAAVQESGTFVEGLIYISAELSIWIVLGFLVHRVNNRVTFKSNWILKTAAWQLTMAFLFASLRLSILYWISYFVDGPGDSRFLLAWPLWRIVEGSFIYAFVASISHALTFFQKFQFERKRRLELKLAVGRAEYDALISHLQPHFLFNALNSINALVTSDPHLAREMIQRLSDLLRFVLRNRQKPMVLLEDELDFAKGYIDLECVRFGDRVKIDVDVDRSLLQVWFPSMVLQPLLENVFKHGVEKKRGDVHVLLRISRTSSRLCCLLTNEMDPNLLPQNCTSFKSGLDNIRRRLELIYSNADFTFHTGVQDPHTFCVTLEIPIQDKGDSPSYE